VGDLVRVRNDAESISYYPWYLANTLGYFEDEGLDVVRVGDGQGPGVAQYLTSSEAEIGLGGLWRTHIYRGRYATFKVFAQLVDRCSSVLLSRQPIEGFDWTQVANSVVMIPGTTTAAMLLHGILRRAGVDLNTVRRIQIFDDVEAADMFERGLGDFYLAGSPTLERMLKQGSAHVAGTLAEIGEVPWSVFEAAPSFLEREDHAAGRFTKAVQRALLWIASHDPSEAPDVFPRWYPNKHPDVVVEGIRGCKARKVWCTDAHVSVPGLARWQPMLVEAGLIDEVWTHEEVVDDREADWAAAELAKAAAGPT